MTVGDRIRNQRELLEISQTELAEKIKISKQTLYKYEKNIITNIPSDKIEKLANVLHVSESYLMGWDDKLKTDNADLIPDILSDSVLIEHMNNILVGQRIRQARTIRQVTLEDISKKVGVAKSTIQRYENGKIKTLKIPVLHSIANALDVNPAWLACKSDVMELPKQAPPTILNYYNRLNVVGKQEATKRVEELSHIPKYTEEITLMAAHNDNADDPEELEKIYEDIMNLKRPE